jgi:hypothetical protein
MVLALHRRKEVTDDIPDSPISHHFLQERGDDKALVWEWDHTFTRFFRRDTPGTIVLTWRGFSGIT